MQGYLSLKAILSALVAYVYKDMYEYSTPIFAKIKENNLQQRLFYVCIEFKLILVVGVFAMQPVFWKLVSKLL